MNENLMTIKTAIVAGCTALGAFLGWKGVMLIAWVAVMALDYLTGTLAACKAGLWSSETAREGLWHKGGMIAVVIVAALADWIMVIVAAYIPIGIQWPGIILPLVLAWYIITELGSILENAVKMGAKVPQWLIKLLKASANIVESAGDNSVMDSDADTADKTVDYN
ncbi:MAG: phage holin family protein [Clostridiales bacterium]|nr:phage holin family protein [Clostridiales bacterium]